MMRSIDRAGQRRSSVKRPYRNGLTATPAGPIRSVVVGFTCRLLFETLGDFMKSLVMPPRTNMKCTVCLLTLLFSAIGLAQTNWQIIAQPKSNYLSSIGVRSNDVSQILLSAEHDGEWDNSSDPNTLRWTFAGGGYFQVHGTRYLAAQMKPQNVYFLDLHGTVTYYSSGNITWYSLGLNPNGVEDGWYALAIDPNDARPVGQKLLVGGPGIIKYADAGLTQTVVS